MSNTAKGKLSERTCVACFRKAARKELLRFVLSKDAGEQDGSSKARVVFDETKRRAGRGVWTCSSKECFEKALLKGKLARGLRASRSTGKLAQDDEMVHELRESVASYIDLD